MAIEKEPNPVSEAYKYIHTNPDFLENFDLDVPEIKMTALDTFAVPKSIVESDEKFLEWFEPRFFKLDEKGIREFSELCQEAADVINTHRYLLSPRKGKDYPLSPSVMRRIPDGFKSPSEIRNFFEKVSLDDSANLEKFFRPDRSSDKGAIKLSICRILTFARLLDGVRKSHNLEAFIENSRYVLGRTGKTEEEPGILSSLNIPGNLEILDTPNGKIHILDWLEKSQAFKHCNVVLGGKDKRKSHYLPEVHVGLKGGERAFLKIARNPEAEFNPLDDFLRLRFLYDDHEDLSTMIDLLYDLQEEAKIKKTPITNIEIRARNYFSKEELERYLPNKVGESEEIAEDEEQETASGEIIPASGFRGLKEKAIKEIRKGDFVDEALIYENPSSGRNYKNITVKIYLHHPDPKGDKKKGALPYFGFEIQIMRKSELKANEEIERHSSHFLIVVRQLAELISRNNASLNKNEFTRLLKENISKIKTEDFPSILLGDAKYKDEKGSTALTFDFEGTLDRKADILFDFLVAEGTLRHVAPNFPSKKVPKRETRMTSGLYLHKEILTRTLESLGYQKKVE